MADFESATIMQPDEGPDSPILTGQLSNQISNSPASPQAKTEIVEPELLRPPAVPGENQTQGDHSRPFGEDIRNENHRLSPSISIPPSETNMNTRMNSESGHRTSYQNQPEDNATYKRPRSSRRESESSLHQMASMPWTTAPVIPTPLMHLEIPYAPQPQPWPSTSRAKAYTSQNPFHRSHGHKARRPSQSTLTPVQDEISSINNPKHQPRQSKGPSFVYPLSRPPSMRTGPYDFDHDAGPSGPSRRGTYESRQSDVSGTTGGMGLYSTGTSTMWDHEPRPHQQPTVVTMPSWEHTHHGMYRQNPSNAGWYWPGKAPIPSVTPIPILSIPRNDPPSESPERFDYAFHERQRTDSPSTDGEASNFNQPIPHWRQQSHTTQPSHAWERAPTMVPLPMPPVMIQPNPNRLPFFRRSAMENVGSTFHHPQLLSAPHISPLIPPEGPANISPFIPPLPSSPQESSDSPESFQSFVPPSISEHGAHIVPAAQGDVENQGHSNLGRKALHQPTFIRRLRRALLGRRHQWSLRKRPSTLETYVPDEQTTMADVIKGVPTQIYLVLLLFLPSLYFSRVGRLFDDAELAMPEMEQMAIRTSSQAMNFLDEQVPDGKEVFPMQWVRLQATWEQFVGSLLREWKTLNVVSALLLSAILTILQIDSAANDYLTRYTALLSLICSLVSLLFGCIFIIRFGTMRKTYVAAEWAMEASDESKASIWWNVFILLAMPAVWLTWSIILYIACIMSFIWRTAPNSQNAPQALSELTIVKIRIGITVVLGLAVLYTCFIVATFRRYGSAMDIKWANRIDNWRRIKAYDTAYSFYDSPKGSVGSPTAVMTPLREDDSGHFSPGKRQVHFRDTVSIISGEGGSPPAHSTRSSISPRRQTREVAHAIPDHGYVPNPVLQPTNNHQAIATGGLQESPLLAPQQWSHDSDTHAPGAEQPILPPITRSPSLLSVLLLQPTQSPIPLPPEQDLSTASSPAHAIEPEPSQEYTSKVDAPSVRDTDSNLISPWQDREATDLHPEGQNMLAPSHVVTHSAESPHGVQVE